MPKRKSNVKTIVVNAKVNEQGRPVKAFAADIKGIRKDETGALVGRNGIRWNV